MGYKEYMRRQILEEMYERMSPEEKRTFVHLTMQDKDHKEIMDALQEISHKADNNHHSWVSDFGANLAGNAVFDGAVWLFSKLFRKL